MKITIIDKPIGAYRIVLRKNATPAENFAADELRKYIYKMTGDSLDIVHGGKSGLFLTIARKEDEFNDGFTIKATKGGLRFTGRNRRGIIYAVYDFIERMGYRFFSAEFACKGYERGDYMAAEEYLFDDTDKTIDETFFVDETPALYYRDAFTYAVTHDADFPKFRLNAESWGLHRLKEEWGGGHDFCGAAGHSFSAMLPSCVYFDKHPEFFAEIDGKRKKNDTGSFLNEPQLCLTNTELPDFLTKKMAEMLRKRYKNFISLSQSDSDWFCQCETCRASYKKYGYFGTLLRFVNVVAENLKKEFPHVRVHTYCYEHTADVDGKTKAADNVLVQYCPRPCHRHSLYDPSCEPNVRVAERLRLLEKSSRELFIYDYRGCSDYALMMLPDIRYLRDQMRCYAESGVKGIYSEMNIFSCMQPSMEELRLYLFSKLTWNPYMSEETYNRHIDEFLEGFYGKGWRKMRAFLEKYQDEATNYHIDSANATMVDENCEYVRRADGRLDQAIIFERSKAERVLKELNALLDEAIEESGDWKYTTRIEIVRTGILWYELYIGMDEILEHGTEEEKAIVIEKNKDLCRRMRQYLMKYSIFISMNNTQKMYGGDYTLSPAKWVNDGNPPFTDSKAFNFDTYDDLPRGN